MKSILFFFSILLLHVTSHGQLKSITTDLLVKNSFQLSLNKVNAISKDTTGANKRDNYLITEKASKDYADKYRFVFGTGFTFNGDTINAAGSVTSIIGTNGVIATGTTSVILTADSAILVTKDGEQNITGKKRFLDTILLKKPIVLEAQNNQNVSIFIARVAGVTYPWLSITGNSGGSQITMGANNSASASDILKLTADYAPSLWTGTYRPLFIDVYENLKLRANRGGTMDTAISFITTSNQFNYVGHFLNSGKFTLNKYGTTSAFKSSDTTNKPLAVDASGNLVRMDNWGGGGSTGSYVDLTTAQTIAGNKTFTSPTAINNTLTLNGMLITTNASGVGLDFSNNGTGNLQTNISNIVPANGTGLRIGSNTDATSSSILDITSTTKGVLIPRMTTAQMDAISSPATGLKIYSLTDSSNYTYDGARWSKGISANGLQTITGTSQGGSSANGVLSLNQTWNTTGNPTALLMNITNTASGASANIMDLKVGGTSQFKVDKTGIATAIFFQATGGINGGASGAVISQNQIGGTGFSYCGVNSYFTWSGASRMYSSSDGIIKFSNNANTDFTRLQFGGTTSSFPAISRNGSGVNFQVADGTAFTATQSLYDRFGAGTPEGVVTAPIGAAYHRTDGGVLSSFYVKESGTSNTGWIAK